MQTFQLRSGLFKAYMFLDRAVGKNREIESFKLEMHSNLQLQTFKLRTLQFLNFPTTLANTCISFKLN